MHIKALKAIKTTGDAVTTVAVVATAAAVDTGSAVTDTAIAGANAAKELASSAVETTGYGLGRSARFVLDATSKVGTQTSNNPLSRGIVSGFYAPEAKASAPVEQTYESVDGFVLSSLNG
jgi:hypothetical protein